MLEKTEGAIKIGQPETLARLFQIRQPETLTRLFQMGQPEILTRLFQKLIMLTE